MMRTRAPIASVVGYHRRLGQGAGLLRAALLTGRDEGVVG